MMGNVLFSDSRLFTLPSLREGRAGWNGENYDRQNFGLICPVLIYVYSTTPNVDDYKTLKGGHLYA